MRKALEMREATQKGLRLSWPVTLETQGQVQSLGKQVIAEDQSKSVRG